MHSEMNANWKMVQNLNNSLEQMIHAIIRFRWFKLTFKFFLVELNQNCQLTNFMPPIRIQSYLHYTPFTIINGLRLMRVYWCWLIINYKPRIYNLLFTRKFGFAMSTNPLIFLHNSIHKTFFPIKTDKEFLRKDANNKRVLLKTQTYQLSKWMKSNFPWFLLVSSSRIECLSGWL